MNEQMEFFKLFIVIFWKMNKQQGVIFYALLKAFLRQLNIVVNLLHIIQLV